MFAISETGPRSAEARRGPSYSCGLCAAAHKVTPLNHSRDLAALSRNFFVFFCLGSKSSKSERTVSCAKRAFRDAGWKPLRSSGGNLDISRDCLFSLDRQRLYFAQRLQSPRAEAPQSGLEGRSHAL